jgi:hypothetical protein
MRLSLIVKLLCLGLLISVLPEESVTTAGDSTIVRFAPDESQRVDCEDRQDRHRQYVD